MLGSFNPRLRRDGHFSASYVRLHPCRILALSSDSGWPMIYQGMQMARRITKSKRRCTKSDVQRLHAKRRALERFDIFLSDEEYRDLATSIRRGKAEFVKKQSNRVSLHRVRLSGGQDAIAVYRKTV